MTSNQRLVQSYLDRHGIGKLFEDMMATVIKEMPNDPMSFLIKLLQKRYKKKNVDSPLSPTSTTRGMGLTGSSIPKKYNNDPQVVIPGSKAVTSAYGRIDNESVYSEDNMRQSKDRNYEKPWQTNSKGTSSKSSKSRKDKEPWDGETKVHGVDEIFEQNTNKHLVGADRNPLSKSLPVTTTSASPITEKLDWNQQQDTHNKNRYSKKDRQPFTTAKKTTTTASTSSTNSIADEEIMLNSNKNNNNNNNIDQNGRMTLSPHGYSKVKRHSSKKKANMQKQKLQTLLSNESNQSCKGDRMESTDDEAIDIIENIADLEGEGVTKQSKGSGYKHNSSQRPLSNTQSANVTVGMCSRCAKILGNDVSTVHSSSIRREDSYVSDGDIESISQIDTSKPFRPKWPVISDSDDETRIIEERKPSKANNSRTTFKTFEEKSVKSDFFDGNSPLRKKTKQFVTPVLSDDESHVTFGVAPSSTTVNENVFARGVRASSPKKFVTNKSPSKHLSSPHKPFSKQAWKQQVLDSNSDDETIAPAMKSTSKGKRATSVGFKLKDAMQNDSDSP